MRKQKVYRRDGHEFTLPQILEEYTKLHGNSIRRQTMLNRFNKGWSYEEMLSPRQDFMAREQNKPRKYKTKSGKFEMNREKTERHDFFLALNKALS